MTPIFARLNSVRNSSRWVEAKNKRLESVPVLWDDESMMPLPNKLPARRGC